MKNSQEGLLGLKNGKERLSLLKLEKEFTSKEIKSAVFALPSEKAPGLNGFPMLFY